LYTKKIKYQFIKSLLGSFYKSLAIIHNNMKKSISILSLFFILVLGGCSLSGQPGEQSGGGEVDAGEYTQKTVLYFFGGMVVRTALPKSSF
jgi:hypothetical protein